MATQKWTGASLNRKQVSRITVANTWTAADTYTLTIDNIDFIITIGTLVTTAQVATTIFQALTGTTFTDTTASCTIPVADGGAALIPQFSEFTATNATASQVDLTANGSGALAGKPFTITVTGDGTVSTGTGAITSIVSPTSQYHGDQADNYSGNAVPVDSDTLVFDNGSVDLRWGLSLGCQLNGLTKAKSYSGNVGLAAVNTDSSSKPYHDYRTRYLTTDDNSGSCVASLETGDGPGSGRFMWDFGAGQTAVTVFGKGTRAEAAAAIPCILLKGTHASNTLSNLAGDVGLAFFAGESATVATIVNGNGPQSDASLICGSGCTLTTVTQAGGYLSTSSAMTTATQYAGNWDHYSGTVTTLTLNGGTFRPRGALTITNCSLYGKIDLSQTAGTVTFTNLVQVYAGAEIYDPNGKATFSAGYKLNCTPDKVKVTRPAGNTVSYS